ncbi:hypothetical protein C8J57DRAFT_1513546 [Mycena rebaudengoi]|nr:hypothetical protein C8J57DRAFT_1513546 [Mycena rebaudengoi]
MTPAEETMRLSSQQMDRRDMEFMVSLCGLSSCLYIDAASTIACRSCWDQPRLAAPMAKLLGCNASEDACETFKYLFMPDGRREAGYRLVRANHCPHLLLLLLSSCPSPPSHDTLPPLPIRPLTNRSSPTTLLKVVAKTYGAVTPREV